MQTVDLKEYEKLNPHMVVKKNGVDAVFATPNRHTAWRVETLFVKEPDTIEWIEEFLPGENFLDVGANVGMYTIWAAKSKAVNVYAFEPESQNFAILNKNIFLNQLDKHVVAYCVALTDSVGFSKLYLSNFIAGSSCHNYDEQINYQNEPMHASFAQGCVGTSIDQLVSAKVIPIPNHIKIDVDGIEPKVIAGAKKTLSDKQVKSLLIEINTGLDEHWSIVDFMLEAGFSYSQQQVDSSVRKEGPFTGVGNYVFRR